METASREGNFGNVQNLELVPVNPEGLTSIDEKQVIRNETTANRSTWQNSGDGWTGSGKGKYQNYTWVPTPKGKTKDKGKDKGKNGKKGKGGKDKEE